MLIPSLVKLKFGQFVRTDGPASHLKKAGTPTMGGIMIIVSFVLAALIFMRDNPHAVAVVLTTVALGFVGFLDDFIIIKKRRSEGLTPKQKLFGQVFVAVVFFMCWRTLPGFSGEMLIPFFPDFSFDFMGINGLLGSEFSLLGFTPGDLIFGLFVIFIFLSCTNGANLTDGLDGLATGVTAIIAVFFLFCAWMLDSPLLPVIGAAVGSLMGFLLFNAHPAKVFMGDTGSLALGGFIAAIALMLNMPLFLAIVAIIYVIESLSVIIQIGYFKMTRRRFFKMAPIHHHFEQSGWPETKVVAFFCVITAMACLLGFLAFQGF